MKKVIVINGSPHTNGTIAGLLHSVADSFNRNTFSVFWYDVNTMKVCPCTGCMACRSSGICVLPHDDAHVLAENIRNCDGLILGTPVYWGNISGQMKLVLDRIVPSMMEESPSGIPLPLHKGKQAVIATACTTIWPFSSLCRETSNTLHALREILFYSGFKTAGQLVLPGTRNIKVIPQKLLKKGKKLSEKF